MAGRKANCDVLTIRESSYIFDSTARRPSCYCPCPRLNASAPPHRGCTAAAAAPCCCCSCPLLLLLHPAAAAPAAAAAPLLLPLLLPASLLLPLLLLLLLLCCCCCCCPCCCCCCCCLSAPAAPAEAAETGPAYFLGVVRVGGMFVGTTIPCIMQTDRQNLFNASIPGDVKIFCSFSRVATIGSS